MASRLSEESFLCAICLEVFTDPVSTPCGHNYCKACITQHWDTSEVCKCPQCLTRFDNRPKLSVNKVLSEVADQFKRKPVVEIIPLERRNQFHRKHNPNTIVYLIIALVLTLTLGCWYYEVKKAELRAVEVQQMIQERRVKIQQFSDSVELSRSHADREKASSERVFTALTSSMRRSQAQIVGIVEENHKAAERRAQGFIQVLQQEIAELEERGGGSELPRLFPARDWTKVQVRDRPPYEQTTRAVLETISKETEEKWCDAELRVIRQYMMDHILDPKAAQHYDIPPEDAKGVNQGHGKDDVLGNTKSFSYLQITVGKQSFSSGRFYYEVEVGGKDDWDLGVAGEVINGHSPMALSPDHYWAIRMRDGRRCYVGTSVLPVNKELQTVGVFVDYQEGLVSFYDVEARVHLYSFTDCSFTQELYPYFCQYFTAGGLKIIRLLVIGLCSFLVYMYKGEINRAMSVFVYGRR